MTAMGDRSLCRFPVRCENYAEDGQKFCERHKCRSYGCREAVDYMIDKPKSGGVFGVRNRDKSGRRILLGFYCKKHKCNRRRPENGARATGYRSPLPYSEYNYEDVFCPNERINDGRYCIDHTCPKSACSNCVFEFFEADADGEFVLKKLFACRGHSQMDPEKIRGRTERQRMTPGDIKRATEEKRRINREREAAERQAREERYQAEREARMKERKQKKAEGR